MKKRKSKAKIQSEKASVDRLALMRKRALSGCRAYTIDEVRALNIRSSRLLDEHISRVFPLLISLVANDRMSIREITELLGFPTQLLDNWLHRNSALREHIRDARKLVTDMNSINDLH